MDTKIKMQFDPDVAKDVGVEEAIMLSNIDYWCWNNELNNSNYHDGRYWTYNSMEAFKKQFPFWTVGRIKGLLKNLKDKGYVEVGSHNKKGYDRTNWYSSLKTQYIAPEAPKQKIGRNQPVDEPKSTNALVGINQPIPDSKPYRKHNTAKTSFACKEDIPIKEKKQGEKRREGSTTKEDKTNPSLIVDFIEIFSGVNPLINYGNKTIRKSAQDLIDMFGYDKAASLAKKAISINGKEFAPVITTPYELKVKMPKLEMYIERNKEKKDWRLTE